MVKREIELVDRYGHEGKKSFLYFLFLFLVVALMVSMFLLYELFPRGTETFVQYELTKNFSSFGSAGDGQFYPNMRFPDSVISYDVDVGCSGSRKADTLDAFNRLSEETILEFYNSPGNPQIVIHCSDKARVEGKMIIAGEGGPNYVVQTDLYNVIYNGSILLLKDSPCGNSNIALHELLHVFGFGHSNVTSSIMYPTSNCEQQLSQDIIITLNKLYSVESLPDLYFTQASANTSGRYLNFNFEIKNQGLKDSDGFNVSVSANDKFLESFFMDGIGVGEGRTLRVSNLKMPKAEMNNLSFVIDGENKIKEINKGNNKIILNTMPEGN